MAGCVHKPGSKEERPDYNNRTSWGKGEFAYIIKGIYDEDLGCLLQLARFQGNIYVLDLYSTDGPLRFLIIGKVFIQTRTTAITGIGTGGCSG